MKKFFWLVIAMAGFAPQSSAKAEEPLHDWLARQPKIAQALYWEGAGASYSHWPQSDQALLEERYRTALRIVRNEKGSFALPDPLPNRKKLADGDRATTVLSRKNARNEFFSSAALSLALESTGALPWSLSDMNAEELAIELDSREFFRLDKANGGYVLDEEKGGLASPANPAMVFRFLRKNKILASSERDTIINFIAWSSGLKHDAVPREVLAQNLSRESARFQEAFWHYRGFMPVMRVLEGTRQTMLPNETALQHWTAGCWGTTGLFRDVLRVINIPVKVGTIGGHAMPIFAHDQTFLSHGDDPYNAKIRRLAPPVPFGELLIPLSRWGQYFGDEKTAAAKVGSRPGEIAAKKE